jgi:hypothetical protein
MSQSRTDRPGGAPPPAAVQASRKSAIPPSTRFRAALAALLAMSLLLSMGPLAVPASADRDAQPTGPIRLPAEPSDVILPSLTPNLVAYYDFENPVPGDPATEQDLGFSGTPLWLVNGGADMRVQDGAYPASTLSMQTQEQPGDLTDWKAGIFDADGVESLNAFNAASEITIGGWFKMTGQNPSPGYNAVGFSGILSGDSEGHAVRALLEVINVDGEPRLVALARRIDGASSQIFAAEEDWEDLLPQDEWVFLTATFDYNSGTMDLYHNGEQLDGFYTNPGDPWDVSGPGPHYSSPTDPTGIKIGGSFPQNTQDRNPCNCRMDSLMFLDRALTAAEVQEQYERFTQEAPPSATATAGSVVPVEVEVAEADAATLSARSNQVSCSTGDPLGSPENARTPGASGVSQSQDAEVLRFRWQTDREWAGTCRQLVVELEDGTVYSERVRLR